MYGTALSFHTYLTYSLRVLARPMQRARARSLYTYHHPPRRHHARTTHYAYAPGTYHAPSLGVGTLLDACTFSIRGYAAICDPPSLCSRECNNTIVLNVKINGIQKGYSLNTHK